MFRKAGTEMKAVIVTEFGGPEVLKMADIPIPAIGPDQVLIKVHATSVNFADIKSRYGQYHGASQPPFVPGLDAAGVVETVGSNVTQWHPGQRVIAFPKNGSYAEYVCADAALTFALPPEIDWDTAAACPLVSFTSYKLLHDVARLTPGETVLVHAAAGGIGTTATQLAKILRAGLVIGAVGDPSKIPVSLSAGADHALCCSSGNFSDQVNDLTGGRGVDVVLDSIAGPVTEQSLQCLAPYGRLVAFGNASGQPGVVRTTDLHASCRAVLGFSLGTTRNERPELLQDTAGHVMNYLATGRLKMTVGRTFPMSEARYAQEWVESRQSTGKVLLAVSPNR